MFEAIGWFTLNKFICTIVLYIGIDIGYKTLTLYIYICVCVFYWSSRALSSLTTKPTEVYYYYRELILYPPISIVFHVYSIVFIGLIALFRIYKYKYISIICMYTNFISMRPGQRTTAPKLGPPFNYYFYFLICTFYTFIHHCYYSFYFSFMALKMESTKPFIHALHNTYCRPVWSPHSWIFIASIFTAVETKSDIINAIVLFLMCIFLFSDSDIHICTRVPQWPSGMYECEYWWLIGSVMRRADAVWDFMLIVCFDSQCFVGTAFGLINVASIIIIN